MSEFFCPLPWIHRFVQHNGIKMCCASQKTIPVSLEEFNNTDHIINVKRTILEGNVPEDCKDCVEVESRGVTSVRQWALSDFPYTSKNVPDVVEFLDLRYSKLCNFSCRTCNTDFSSSIEKEVLSNPNLSKYFKIKNADFDFDVEKIIDSVPQLTRLNLTGGEPLIIKEHLRVLDMLVCAGKTDVNLIITTNASTFNKRIIDLIKQFTNVHWTVSIDAVGNSAEYIRHGTNWSQVNSNVEKILSLGHSVSVNTTLSALSVLEIASLAHWFKELKERYYNQPFELGVGLCTIPNFMSPNSLPDHLRPRAIEQIETAILVISNIPNQPRDVLDALEHLHLTLKTATINPDISKKFIQFTQELDKSRNQNFNTTFNLTL